MALATATFAVLDACAKEVMRTLPHDVAVFFRYFLALLFAGYMLMRAGGLSLLETHHPFIQLMRGLMLLASTILNFAALNYLQLAQTAAISFMIPLWICALSGPMLGEHVGWRRWTAVVVGFLGVLVIMRPGTMSFHWAMFFSLGATMAGAIYNILTRKVGGVDRVETSLFYASAVGSLGAAVTLPWHWQTPTGYEWVYLLIMGVAGGGGHFLLTLAHRLAPASVLAPFTYTQIIWMIILGFVLFGDLPDHWTLMGAGIVIASGLFVFLREKKQGQETTLPAPAD